MGSPNTRTSAYDRHTSQSVWISKHPPPSKPLPPLPVGQDASLPKAVMTDRPLTSTNMCCRIDMQRSTCGGSGSKDECQGTVSPTAKRSFTPDHVAGLCSQLDTCSVGKRESIAASSRSSERTVTPVPSLAFSYSSSSTVLEPESPPIMAENGLDEREFNEPAMTTKPTSLHRKSRRPLAVRSERNELRRTISPPMPSPLPDGSLFQARLPPFQDGYAYHPGRAVPMIPSRCPNNRKLSDVSFIDWDSDEENRPFPQLAKVNASLKKGMADIRATRKPKSRSVHPQALQIHRTPESSRSSSMLSSSRRSKNPMTDGATTQHNEKSQILGKSPTNIHHYAKSRDNLAAATTTTTTTTTTPPVVIGAITYKQHSIPKSALRPVSIAPAQPHAKPSSECDLRRKPKKLSVWIRKASCT